MLPNSIAPNAVNAAACPTTHLIMKYKTIGASTGNNDGITISRIAAFVSKSTATPYSGFPVPSIIPLISLN